MSHRVIIIKSNRASSVNMGEQPSPYDITVEYTPPDAATPEQVGAEVKRITKKINAIENGTDSPEE